VGRAPVTEEGVILQLLACGIFGGDDGSSSGDGDADLDIDVDADADADADGDADADAEPSCRGNGFAATTVEWALPTGFPDLTFEYTSDSDSSDAWHWGLLDLAGDDLPDLVFTTTRGDEDVGTSEWQIYENEGAGFSGTSAKWGLPQGFPDATFEYVADSDYSDDYNWSLVDMDGDGRSDLVLSWTRGTGLGTESWNVYLNEGDGFASTPIRWNLPAGYPDQTFEYTADGDGTDAYDWALLDLEGDGLLDLVLTHADEVGNSGTTRWLVYANEGDGFAESTTNWGLPVGYPNLTFQWFYDGDGTDDYHWGLADLDGDGASDLVIAAAEAMPALGTERWQVYLNEGDGFAQTSTDWDLPAGFPDHTFDYPYDGDYTDDYMWYLVDLHGDDVPDLVFTTSEGAGSVGTDRWQVYENDGSGAFSGSATNWALPDGYRDATFEYLGDGDHSDGYAWGLVNLDGDSVTDLVFSHSDAIEGSGTESWNVYLGNCE
jgi:hypothetical protein